MNNYGSEIDFAISIMLAVAAVLIGILIITFIKYFLFPYIKEKMIDKRYYDESNIVRFSYDYGYHNPNIKIISFYKSLQREYKESHEHDDLFFTSNNEPIGLGIIKKYLDEIHVELNYDDEMYVYDYTESELWRMKFNEEDHDDVSFIPMDIMITECIWSSDPNLNVHSHDMILYKPMNENCKYKTLMYMPHPLHQTLIMERDAIWKELVKRK